MREVVYRLEAGEDVTVSSLFSVLRALGLAIRVESAGMPTMEECVHGLTGTRTMLPSKIRERSVAIGEVAQAGQLLKTSFTPWQCPAPLNGL
ncbi:hypothetical protein [Roseateles depolymerans]|uniref:hypothetical protein n=1 Tax=Roseateles depolymerans TaxID=76731 RepID=UPI00287398CB|nr:hypothetical protein [Roseateles depolymerans]